MDNDDKIAEILGFKPKNSYADVSKPKKMLLWHTQLIETNMVTGDSVVLRSFSNPAKESDVKRPWKGKKASKAIKDHKDEKIKDEEVY